MDDLRNYQAEFQPPMIECRCAHTKGVGSALLPLPSSPFPSPPMEKDEAQIPGCSLIPAQKH